MFANGAAESRVIRIEGDGQDEGVGLVHDLERHQELSADRHLRLRAQVPDLEGHELLDDLAEVFKTCGQIPLEIAGHTDSQGREEMNQKLSQSRAQAVLVELQRRRILTSSFVAKRLW